jgi:hypothetical protein
MTYARREIGATGTQKMAGMGALALVEYLGLKVLQGPLLRDRLPSRVDATVEAMHPGASLKQRRVKLRPSHQHDRDLRMNRQPAKMLWPMVLAVPVVLALTGCSSNKFFRSSRQMCVAHGGQYSPETKECAFAAATKVSGQKACQDLGGVYMTQEQRYQFDD